jgi:hypothetical protein
MNDLLRQMNLDFARALSEPAEPEPRYPLVPGAKVAGTSRDAADKVAPKVAGGRRLGPKTPDEVAAAIGKSVLYVRPRMSELAAQGLVEKTGVRRPNDSGLDANEWRVK